MEAANLRIDYRMYSVANLGVLMGSQVKFGSEASDMSVMYVLLDISVTEEMIAWISSFPWMCWEVVIQ